jgi:competence protein ComEA
MSEIIVTTTWRERLEELFGRRRETWLVAGAVLLVVLGALVLKARSAGPSIAPPATAVPSAGAPAVVPPMSPGVAPTSAATILVHVAGAVHRPGLYEMPAGSRVADAIDLARGPLNAADLDALNLAEALSDGMKLDVPRRGEAIATTASVAPAPGTSAPSGVVAVNEADQAALETIPGIGPVTAAAIIAHRTEVGQFDSIDQLLEVTGIGPATLESMRPYITL